MKLHHTKYKKNYLRYLSEVMETEDGRNPIEEALEQIFERFYSEYDWRVKQVGKQRAMVDWLQGLAIPIEYTYLGILRLAKDMGSCDDVLDAWEEDLICDNYWSFMANIILQHEWLTKDFNYGVNNDLH